MRGVEGDLPQNVRSERIKAADALGLVNLWGVRSSAYKPGFLVGSRIHQARLPVKSLAQFTGRFL